MRVSRLSIKGSHDGVEASNEVAHLVLAAGKCTVEAMDDVADLAKSAARDDCRQRGQRLFGGWVGEGVGQRNRGAWRELAVRCLPGRWVESDVHRSEQTGLSKAGHRVGGHYDLGLDRDLHVGVPVGEPHRPDTADDDVVNQHGRIRFQRTDIGDLDVVDVCARTSADRPRQGQRVHACE